MQLKNKNKKTFYKKIIFFGFSFLALSREISIWVPLCLVVLVLLRQNWDIEPLYLDSNHSGGFCFGFKEISFHKRTCSRENTLKYSVKRYKLELTPELVRNRICLS